jgi:hypothetical protein
MASSAKPFGRRGRFVARVSRVRPIGARLKLRPPGPAHLPDDLVLPKRQLLTWN